MALAAARFVKLKVWASAPSSLAQQIEKRVLSATGHSVVAKVPCEPKTELGAKMTAICLQCKALVESFSQDLQNEGCTRPLCRWPHRWQRRLGRSGGRSQGRSCIAWFQSAKHASR